MSHVKELIDKVRTSNQQAKTARERVKTASTDDLTGRGDLLANTIHQITAQEEERVFPEEVRLRKEAAERAATVPPAAPAPAATKEAAAAAPAAQVDDDQTKEASSVSILDVNTLLKNPLVKQGFEEVLRENSVEIRQCVSTIIANAGA